MMKKKKIIIPENYLLRIPSRPDTLLWEKDDNGMVTLKIENNGWANRIAQKLFFRPRYSQVHLDRFGSFIWLAMDGKKDITAIGRAVEETFGEEVNPLYERLARYFQILDSYHFIAWNTPTDK